MRRTPFVLTLLALVIGLLAPTATAAPASFDRAPLPDGFQPEGIEAFGSTAYLGSRVDGDLYRLNLRTGRGQVFSQGPGTPSMGLKVDRAGRLFVAGGTAGDARVVDAVNGHVLASYTLTTGTAFINDVVLTDDEAYFTDSANAQLFELPLVRGQLPTQADVRRIPLTGDWRQVSGNNANGITTTPDGSALLVINSSLGTLFRVDPTTGAATVVDTGGDKLANGDGMLREGTTLYVVQNRNNKIAVLRLDRSGSTARRVDTIRSDLFDVPSTVAESGGSLYLPNARFTTPATPTTPYDVTRARTYAPR